MTDDSAIKDQVSLLLQRASDGDIDAAQELMSVVYGELHALAEHRMARERKDSTLRPTALVHEAWLRLARSGMGFESRAHFFGAAAQAMRRVLIDHARRFQVTPRGAARERVTLSEADVAESESDVDLLVLGEALERLESIDAVKCNVVTMRYILGCTVEETATALGCSAAKVKKDWAFARAWLQRELAESGEAE